MKLEKDFREKEYYKITLVGLKPDQCSILKGPEEEKRLAAILLDDYHSTRYEKMLQLVVKEQVAKEDQDTCFKVFSLENLQEAFQQGKEQVTYSYKRNINGTWQGVSAEIYPRKFGAQGELEEFMIYISRNGQLQAQN